MTRRRHTYVLALLLPALLFTGCGKDSGDGGSMGSGGVAAKPAPPDELSQLCPDGALVLVRFNDIQSIEEELVGLVSIVEPNDVDDARITKQIGENALMNPTMAGVDLDRPMAIAVFLSDMGAPSPVFILPVTSEAEYRKALEAGPMWEFVKDQTFLKPVGGDQGAGGWIVQGNDQALVQSIKMNGTPCPLARKLLGGDVAVAVDLEALNELVAPEIDNVMSSIDPAMMDMPPMMGPMLEGLGEGVKEFMASSDSIALSGSMTEGDMLLTIRYQAREGTATAQSLADARKSKPQYLSQLGTMGFMAVECQYSGESMWDLFGPIYDAVFASLDQEMVDTLKTMTTLADGLGMGIGLANGFEMVSLSHVTDAAAYEKAMKTYMGRMDEVMKALTDDQMAIMPMTFEPGEPWEHAGVTVAPMTMVFDMGSIPDPDAAQFLQMFFGPDGLGMQTAVVGEYVVATAGPTCRNLMTDTIDRVKSGSHASLPSAYEDATMGFPEEVNGILYVNLADIALMVNGIEGIPVPEEKKALLASPPSDLYMAGYIRTDGPTMTMGMRLRLGGIMKYAKAIFDD
jgi:hypothetical protein